MSSAPVVLPYDEVGSGDGRPVLLLHSLALDRHVWDELAPLLADGRRVLALDLRGHGEAPTDADFTIENMAADVAATIASLGFDDVAVVGMSMGGCVAQAVAIHHGDLVGGLGLIDTTAWYGPDAKDAWEGRAQKAMTEGLRSLTGFQLNRWFGDEFREANPERGEELLEVFAANDLPSYASSCRALGAFDVRARLGDVAAPTVVIVGEDDPATSPEHARSLHEAIPGSTLHVLEGAKHLTAVERPDDVAELLRPIL